MRIEIVIAKWLGFPPGGGRTALKVVLACALFSLGAASLFAATNQSVTINGHEAHPTRILAKFKNASGPVVYAADLRQVGSMVSRRYTQLPELALFEEDNLPPLPTPITETSLRTRLLSRMEALRQTGLFDYVEPDYIIHLMATPTDAAFVDGRLWGLRNSDPAYPGVDISAVDAWDLTTGSTNVIVAVIDTGVRYTHQDLKSQMWRNPGEIPGNGIDDDGNGYVDDVYGINAITGSGDPMDDNDHGTHVSGTIGASANDVGPNVGVCWKVRIMALKCFDRYGYLGDIAEAITCIDYAVANGARILNNSWGGGGYSQALYDAIDSARQADVLFVAAAGNGGWDGIGDDNDQDPAYPASYPLDNIISVAAITRTNTLASFSNYGLKSVDLGAPGVDIFSCIATADTAYDTFMGTSMAAPHVCGVAALVMSQFPAWDMVSVRNAILASAEPMTALTGKCVTGGRLNAYYALTTRLRTGMLQISVDPPAGSVLIAAANQPLFVTVRDVVVVTNATVIAKIPGVVTNAFANDGAPPDTRAADGVYSAYLPVPATEGQITMTVEATATDKVGATNVISYTVITLPPNDYFTNATKVPAAGAAYLANNRLATMERLEPTHGGVQSASASLWWNWTPTSNTNVFISTAGSAIDPILAVYTGNKVTNLTQVAASIDTGARATAYVKFNASSGVTYRIAAASKSPSLTGSLRLRVVPGGTPDTDRPALSVTSPLSGLWVSNKFVTVSGTASDLQTGASGLDKVSITVNEDWEFSANGTTNWSGLIALAPGLHKIQVTAQDLAGNVSLPAKLQLTYVEPNPPNNHFVTAIPLTLTNGAHSVPISTTNATREFGEPQILGNHGGKSVWWYFQPAVDGVITLNTVGSTFDTLLGIYTGTNVSSLTTIVENDDALSGVTDNYSLISQAVRANHTYYVAVDGYDGASGTVILSHSFAPTAVYRLTTSHGAGGVITVTTTNGLGGLLEMPGTAGDFAANATVVLTGIPEAYYQFNGWGGSVVSSANPLTNVMVSDLSVTGSFVAIPLADGFESGNLSHIPWTTAGNAPWLVQSSVVSFGNYAARSGTIGDNQSSSLIVTLPNFVEGSGSFDYRVSSEANFDLLKFYVNGELVQQWSGEVDWANFAFPLEAGTNTLEWRYVKDYTLSSGLDAAFIDNLALPLSSTPTNNPEPVELALQRQADGSFVVTLAGQSGQQYVVQMSTNLVSWQNLSTNIAVGGSIILPDPGSVTNPVRFYRAVAAP